MFVLKCFRCSNLRLPSHDILIIRRFSPLTITRSLADMPRKHVLKDQSSQAEKQPAQFNRQFEPFYDMITRRRDEALRSVIISFGQDSESQVMPFLKSLDGVKQTLFYALQGLQKKYVLVEFSTIQAVNSILTDAGSDTDLFPQAEGRVLFLKKFEKKSSEKLLVDWNSLQPSSTFLLPEMSHCSNLDEVMERYLNNLEVSDLTTRLHFITCVQIERIFLGAFPKVRVIPFGSSVNGFGRKGSDLDVSLLFNHRLTFSRNIIKQNHEHLMIRPLQSEKSSKDVLYLFGSMLQVMLPSCSNVITVPHARVPIIKFKDNDTGCDCDLNLTGSLGICMSEILYTLSSWDERCRSVLFTVRAWARHHGVTTSISPSSKLTNFSLLLLVVFYLQTRNVLPTINEMEELADDRDLLVYQGEPHLFLRHVTPSKIEQWQKQRGKTNNESAAALLTDFFKFYAKFPFESKAITISNGKVLNNPTRDALYIVNPLEETLNVARNVRVTNVDLFKLKCKEAHSALSFTQWQSPLKRWSFLFDQDESLFKKKTKQNLIAEIFQDEGESMRRHQT